VGNDAVNRLDLLGWIDVNLSQNKNEDGNFGAGAISDYGQAFGSDPVADSSISSLGNDDISVSAFLRVDSAWTSGGACNTIIAPSDGPFAGDATGAAVIITFRELCKGKQYSFKVRGELRVEAQGVGAGGSAYLANKVTDSKIGQTSTRTTKGKKWALNSVRVSEQIEFTAKGESQSVIRYVPLATVTGSQFSFPQMILGDLQAKSSVRVHLNVTLKGISEDGEVPKSLSTSKE
jgi:hypothetical protein